MKLPPEVLTAILAGHHLDMNERADLGLLPLEVLDYNEVRDHLATVIETTEAFPRAYLAHEPGRVVDEHIVIEHRSDGRYIGHALRAHPIQPTVLAEETHREFRSSRRAAEWFLRWEHHLPGTLDGWRVV